MCFCAGRGADGVGWRCSLRCLVVSQDSVSTTVAKEQVDPYDITKTSALRITAQHNKQDRSRDHTLLEHSQHSPMLNDIGLFGKVGGSGLFYEGLQCYEPSPVYCLCELPGFSTTAFTSTPSMKIVSQETWSSLGPLPVRWCFCNARTSTLTCTKF